MLICSFHDLYCYHIQMKSLFNEVKFLFNKFKHIFVSY